MKQRNIPQAKQPSSGTSALNGRDSLIQSRHIVAPKEPLLSRSPQGQPSQIETTMVTPPKGEPPPLKGLLGASPQLGASSVKGGPLPTRASARPLPAVREWNSLSKALNLPGMPEL
jgi:hypothetical protein